MDWLARQQQVRSQCRLTWCLGRALLLAVDGRPLLVSSLGGGEEIISPHVPSLAGANLTSEGFTHLKNTITSQIRMCEFGGTQTVCNTGVKFKILSNSYAMAISGQNKPQPLYRGVSKRPLSASDHPWGLRVVSAAGRMQGTKGCSYLPSPGQYFSSLTSGTAVSAAYWMNISLISLKFMSLSCSVSPSLLLGKFRIP